MNAQVNQRNQILDALKGICIIFVVITHFKWTEEMRLLFLFPYTINMAVPVFMLISGYVYAASYTRSNVKKLLQGWSIRRLRKSFLRYTLPFIICFIVELFLYGLNEFAVHSGGTYSLKKQFVHWLLVAGGLGAITIRFCYSC